jgi:hypothetical protein
MRQRLTIILTFVVIIAVLVIINTVTHVKQEKIGDSEFAANRSTYHSGPTGTRALHDFLSETGYKVMRWREAPDKLLGESGKLVRTFVVIGRTQLPFNEEHYVAIRKWVTRGGRLVLIDRSPDPELLPRYAGWTITARELAFPDFDTDPADVRQMTDSVTALQPTQPTALTYNVQAVMPSRFASRLTITAEPVSDEEPPRRVIALPTESPEPEGEEPVTAPPPALVAGSQAPVVHVSDRDGALLVDYSYGRGKVIVLSDPYIVTNGGISLNDNLQLAINALGGPDALIAFDEYHQGRGVTRNAFASYFAGTPVLAIAAQIVLLVLFILWTNGRRFGRPLPLPRVDRRSSLEFVASMAELQERSRAFDLAIENIYSRTRRVLARHAGVDYNTSRSEIAARIASRSTIDRDQLETLMRQCEEAINGQPISWRQSIDLVRRLRELERKLGLRMRSREVRQAAENI